MLAIIFFIVIPLVLFFYFKYNIGSIMVILFFLFIFYYTPYSFYLEPSYWQFRNMCKLNELPNDENKYNKILSYFDTDLESLDWDRLNEKTWKIKETNGDYKKGIFEYAALTEEKQLNSRAGIIARVLSNKSPISKYNTNQMSIDISWRTRRYFLERKYMTDLPHQAEWIERTLACVDVAKENMTPRGVNNE